MSDEMKTGARSEWLTRTVLAAVLLIAGVFGLLLLTPFVVVMMWQAGMLNDEAVNHFFLFWLSLLQWLGLMTVHAP